MNEGEDKAVRELARRIRLQCLNMVLRTGAPHIGSSLSLADILAALYGNVMRLFPQQPNHPERDRFILSKGHGASALYAVLAEKHYFPVERLASFCKDGSALGGHVCDSVPGVEVSTGSLGHGLSLLAGSAYSGKLRGRGYRCFGVLSDGECNEGSVWEAALFAAHHGLGALTVVVDCNGLQGFGRTKEVLDLGDLGAKWRSFGWEVAEGDGHDLQWLLDHLSPPRRERPRVLLAHTIKGKGVSFMEDRLEWHYRAPTESEWKQAVQELGGADEGSV